MVSIYFSHQVFKSHFEEIQLSRILRIQTFNIICENKDTDLLYTYYTGDGRTWFHCT